MLLVVVVEPFVMPLSPSSCHAFFSSFSFFFLLKMPTLTLSNKNHSHFFLQKLLCISSRPMPLSFPSFFSFINLVFFVCHNLPWLSFSYQQHLTCPLQFSLFVIHLRKKYTNRQTFQLSRILRETHTFHLYLTLACIGSIFSSKSQKSMIYPCFVLMHLLANEYLYLTESVVIK